MKCVTYFEYLLDIVQLIIFIFFGKLCLNINLSLNKSFQAIRVQVPLLMSVYAFSLIGD